MRINYSSGSRLRRLFATLALAPCLFLAAVATMGAYTPGTLLNINNLADVGSIYTALTNLHGMPQTLTNSTLARLSSTSYSAVTRLGYYAVGDADAVTMYPQNAACTVTSFVGTVHVAANVLTIDTVTSGELRRGLPLTSSHMPTSLGIVPIARLSGNGGVGSTYSITGAAQTFTVEAMTAWGDGGQQVPSADGKCFKALYNTYYDITEFGGDNGATFDNRLPIQAAIDAAFRAQGCAWIPGRTIPWRVWGKTGVGLVPSVGSALLSPDGDGGCVMGVGPLNNLGATNPATRSGSTIQVMTSTDGIVQRDETRHNNFIISHIGIIGNAPSATDSQQTAGVHIGYSTGWVLDTVTVADFVTCIDFDSSERAGAGSTNWPNFECSQQSGGPNKNNGYPFAAVWAHGNQGQLQGWTPGAGSYAYSQQLAGGGSAYVFEGDDTTTDYTINLQPSVRLYTAWGLKVRVRGNSQLPGTDYTMTDETPGAPSKTIYAASPTISTIFGSNVVTVSSTTGLPSSFTCSGTSPWPCEPSVALAAYGIPAGCYIQSISGSGAGAQVTLAAKGSTGACKARVTTTNELATFAQTHIGQRAGCGWDASANIDDVNAYATSNCGTNIKVHLLVAPLSDDPDTHTPQEIDLYTADPWGVAGIWLDGDPFQFTDGRSSASANNIDNFDVGGYWVGFVDLSGGNNRATFVYSQFLETCADVWTVDREVTFPSSSSSTVGSSDLAVRCPGYFGNNAASEFGGIPATTKMSFGGIENQISPLSFPRNVLLCGDLDACPWQTGATFSGIGTSPVYTADGWFAWSSGSAGTTVQRDGSGTMRVQRTAALTDSETRCVGQVVRSNKVKTLGTGSLAQITVSFNVDYHPTDFDAVRKEVQVVVAVGTAADQGKAGFIGKSWTGYAELVNAAHDGKDGRRRSYVAYIPPGAQEMGIKLCSTWDGHLAATNDYFRVSHIQIESGIGPSPFEYRDQSFELMLARAEFEMSYALNTVPGIASTTGNEWTHMLATGGGAYKPTETIRFLTAKVCNSPTVTLYSPDDGATGQMYLQATGNRSASVSSENRVGFIMQDGTAEDPTDVNKLLSTQWTANCRL